MIGFLFLFLLSFLVGHHWAYFYGIFIVVVNAIIYWLYFVFYIKKKSRYQTQGLVVVISSMIVRFMVVAALIVYGVRSELNSESMLIGFSLGLLLYLYNHIIMVSGKYGE